MRVLKFDAHASEALQALNFTLAADQESATLTGEVTIAVIRPAHPLEMEFRLVLTLPNGSELTCHTRRRDLLGLGESSVLWPQPIKRKQSDA
jgi:hypothetical protein